jgi:glycosyltransferase involved in cell wall biosynthesis
VIEGFARAAAHRHGLHLILCLQGGGAEALAALQRQVTQAVPGPTREETLSVVGSAADGTETRLRAGADFFLCADAAPGLHIPLVEAMWAGLPLVTTMTAGTASFLPAEAAVTIATERQTFAGDDEPISRFLPLTCHAPTADAVKDAVIAAASLDAAARAHLAKTGREIAERRFGLAAFRQGLTQLAACLPPEAG